MTTRKVDEQLLRRLRDTFEPVEAVRCALLTGSHSRGLAHPGSNVDVQLVLTRFDDASTETIRTRRGELQAALGAAVSVNVHTLADAHPSLGRFDQFSHKNRADMFILQAKYTALPVCGSNVFADFDDPPPSRMRREAIRTVASFSYNLRKYVFDPAFAAHGAAEFVRMPLIALEFISAFFGYVSLGYRDGIEFLTTDGFLLDDEVAFLEDCAERKATSSYGDVDSCFALRATRFLDVAHDRLLSTYRCRAVSDLRWNGRSYETHWDINRPQAASMSVVRDAAGRVLLLQRPPGDYLYPEAWTIPGGYINQGESPAEAAYRELREETGKDAAVRALFEGEPSVGARLAAFAFEVTVSDARAPRLTEHSRHRLVDVRDALRMDLTPEARQILEKYAVEELGGDSVGTLGAEEGKIETQHTTQVHAWHGEA